VQSTADQVGAQAAQAYHGQGIALATQMVIGIVKDLLPAGKKRKEIIQALRGIAAGGGAEAGTDFETMGRALGGAFGTGASTEITSGKSAETVANGVRGAAANVETVAAGSFRQAGFKSVVAYVRGIQETLKPGTEEHDAFMLAVTKMIEAIQEPLLIVFRAAALNFAKNFIQTIVDYVRPETPGFVILDQAMIDMMTEFNRVNALRFIDSGLMMGVEFIAALKHEMSPNGSLYSQLQEEASALAASLARTVTYTVQLVFGGWEEGSGPPKGAMFSVEERAKGGPVSARTPYLVGERGPELFMPSVSGSVISNNDLTMTRTGSTSGGANTYNVTINAGLGTDGAAVGRQLVEYIRKYERQSGKAFAAA
jgi:hypothetical protein